MISKDLIFDNDDDLKIDDGDFAINQSDDQNIETIILAEKGQFYNAPLLGYGIYTRINGPFNKNSERKAIREELKRDNYNVISLEINENFELLIDADKIK